MKKNFILSRSISSLLVLKRFRGRDGKAVRDERRVGRIDRCDVGDEYELADQPGNRAGHRRYRDVQRPWQWILPQSISEEE